MLRYYQELHEIYRLDIEQYVFYIGKARLRMSNSLVYPNINYRYNLIDFRNLEVDDF